LLDLTEIILYCSSGALFSPVMERSHGKMLCLVDGSYLHI